MPFISDLLTVTFSPDVVIRSRSLFTSVSKPMEPNTFISEDILPNLFLSLDKASIAL